MKSNLVLLSVIVFAISLILYLGISYLQCKNMNASSQPLCKPCADAKIEAVVHFISAKNIPTWPGMVSGNNKYGFRSDGNKLVFEEFFAGNRRVLRDVILSSKPSYFGVNNGQFVVMDNNEQVIKEISPALNNNAFLVMVYLSEDGKLVGQGVNSEILWSIDLSAI